MIGRAALLLLAWAAVGCCTPAACREENLPPTRWMRTPADTVDFFRYTCRHECYDLAYDALSRRTQEAVSRLAFSLFFPSETVPGTSIRVRDLVVQSRTVDVIVSTVVRPDGRLGRVASAFLEAGDWTQQVLLFPEEDEAEPGRIRWKLGLLESFEFGLFRNVQPERTTRRNGRPDAARGVQRSASATRRT